ncbi:MAG: Fic family protein [Leptospirillum sp.]|jgi:Fic family protein
MATLIGYQWLIKNLDLDVPSPAQISMIGEPDNSESYPKDRIRTFRKEYQVSDDPISHLCFALKHESIDLSIIDRTLRVIDRKTLEKRLNESLGKYERKIGFYYEFLIGNDLDVPKMTTGNYIDLLDPSEYFTAPPDKSQKWRVNNNLIGTPEFCPIVRKTPVLMEFIDKNLDKKVKDLLSSYPLSVILRANQYLYLKETKSSFMIEREEPKGDRIQRFVQLLHRRNAFPGMTKEDFIRIQNMIVDPRFSSKDYRTDQNYVGERIGNGTEIVHYISPSPDSVGGMMDGLIATMTRTRQEVHPVIRAACLSFGFVFIHPFDDGNGRIHRFLIHDILAKGNFTPDDAIFPVSAHILNNMDDYDRCLESFSRKVMEISRYEIDSEGILTKKNDTDFIYKYFDATAMSEYLFKVIEETINVDIPAELDFLLRYEKAKKEIQAIVDMPDSKIDLFIDVCRQNNGVLSVVKRKKFFPMLSDEEVSSLENVVSITF